MLKSRTGLKSDFPEFQSKNSKREERGRIKGRSQEVVGGLTSDQVSVMSRPGQPVQLYTVQYTGSAMQLYTGQQVQLYSCCCRHPTRGGVRGP